MPTPLTQQNNNRVILGRLGSAYGIKGWLRCHSFTDPRTNIFDYPEWQIEHAGTWQTISYEFKPHGEGFVVKLPGVDTPEDARLYANDDIAINRDQLPPPNSDEYYWCDLIGLAVKTLEGKNLGNIIEMRDTGANDIMIVKGDKRHLVPFIDHVVQTVDFDQKAVIVDWDDDF